MSMGDMMKKDFSNSIGEKLAIPTEAVSTLPLTEIRGKRNVSVENHRGILTYREEEIKLRVKRGAITIQGTALKIAHMNRRRIEIRGNIQAVVLE